LPTPTISPTTTPRLLSEEERVALLDEVWSTVKDNYLYADFHGDDWAAARDRYEPRVRAAVSADELYSLLAEMVAELGDDHSRFLSPSDARAEDAQQRGNADYVGIGIVSSPGDRSVMVVFVFPGSPAERAGLMRRDRITHVDGQALSDPRNEPSKIRGPAGTSVRLTVISPGRVPRDVDVVRERITGGVSPTAHRLGINPAVGFLVIPDLWTGDMDRQVDRALGRLLDEAPPLTGLIIDLRGNGGGYRTVLENILGDLVSGKVGEFYDKNGTYPFEITPRALQSRLKGVQVAVLTDGGTESYAEVLAASVQVTGRGIVVGRPSAGNTETIFPYDFDDGSRLWVAEQGFRLPDGTGLEGRGVLPDEAVTEDWTAFSENNDPDILRALQHFGQQGSR
jgi:carboxyl-terminal processing protease